MKNFLYKVLEKLAKQAEMTAKFFHHFCTKVTTSKHLANVILLGGYVRVIAVRQEDDGNFIVILWCNLEKVPHNVRTEWLTQVKFNNLLEHIHYKIIYLQISFPSYLGRSSHSKTWNVLYFHSLGTSI